MSVLWGILGTANIAKKIIPAIQESNEGNVYAIASRNLERAKKFSKDFNIDTFYGNYNQLLENDDIAAIYIPLPNNLHLTWALEAAKHGKHILCEKPFALNKEEAEKMFKAGSENNIIMMEAFMYRFDPKIERIKQILKDGIIGELKNINFNFSHRLEEIFTESKNYRMNR